jgi:hypothetical protein
MLDWGRRLLFHFARIAGIEDALALVFDNRDYYNIL